MPNNALEARVAALETAVRAIVDLLDDCHLAGTSSGDFDRIRLILEDLDTGES